MRDMNFHLTSQIYQDQVSLLVNSSEAVDERMLKKNLSCMKIAMYLEGCSATDSESFFASAVEQFSYSSFELQVLVRVNIKDITLI